MSSLSRIVPGQPMLKGICVLAVDDDPDVLDLVSHVLARAGAEVVVACGGAEALRLMSAHGSADIIVSDLMMPFVDGCELLRQIRGLSDGAFHDVPALALSGAGRVLEQQARDAGFQSVERKPISPERLVVAVASLLR